MNRSYQVASAQELFNPTGAEFTQIEYPLAVLPDEARTVAAKFNHADPEKILAELETARRTDPETGIGFGMIARPGDSRTDAIVQFHSYANGPTDNFLGRALFIKEVADEIGFHDEEGNALPVYSFGAPSSSSSLNVSRADIGSVRRGDFAPIAIPNLDLVRRMGVGRVACVAASLGAAVALSAAGEADQMGIDVLSLTVASLPNIVDRKPWLELLPAFNSQAANMSGALENGGVDLFTELHKGDSAVGFAKEVIAEATLNHAQFKGLSRSTALSALIRALRTGAPITEVHGTDDPITPLSAIDQLHSDIDRYDYAQQFQGIRVIGANHADLGDNVPLIASLYAYGLQQ